MESDLGHWRVLPFSFYNSTFVRVFHSFMYNILQNWQRLTLTGTFSSFFFFLGMLTTPFYLHESLSLFFYPQRGSRFGVHLDRVLSLPPFHLADFVPFLAAWSGSEAYGSAADVDAAPQLWAHSVPLRGGRWRLAFVHGCVNFRASRDVKSEKLHWNTALRLLLCVLCWIYSFFSCVGLFVWLFGLMSVFFSCLFANVSPATATFFCVNVQALVGVF